LGIDNDRCPCFRESSATLDIECPLSRIVEHKHTGAAWHPQPASHGPRRDRECAVAPNVTEGALLVELNAYLSVARRYRAASVWTTEIGLTRDAHGYDRVRSVVGVPVRRGDGQRACVGCSARVLE